MPVGTYGSVKAMRREHCATLGAQIVLGNTFHLYPATRLDVIEAHGGLHGFMRWTADPHRLGRLPGVLAGERRKITRQGVTFASPVDGSQVFLGPEEIDARSSACSTPTS
jgi:queuine tRNA-ribosyltransferase